LKDADEPPTVVAVPLTVGSVPSVVYLTLAGPEPAPSFALSAIETGDVVYQPAEHAAVLHVTDVVGAVVSFVIVKLVVFVLPELSVAVSVCAPL
jgi:hypothetical protein